VTDLCLSDTVTTSGLVRVPALRLRTFNFTPHRTRSRLDPNARTMNRL
jgi:hypothetical protein